MTRKPPNLTEKLAAALLELRVANSDGHLVPVIDRSRAKGLTAQQIIALFECDHWPVPVALGGSNHPTNLHWKSKREHREKTAKQDVPMIAKCKRISEKQEAFRRRLTAKSEPVAAGAGDAVQRAKREWPHRPLRSRGFERRASRPERGDLKGG